MPLCPICGYPNLKEPPRASSGGGSYEICPCCGFQFGVDDDDRGITDEQARERWIAKGMPWYSKSRKAPAAWNAEKQLQALSTSADASKPKPATKPTPPKKTATTKKATATTAKAKAPKKITRKKSTGQS